MKQFTFISNNIVVKNNLSLKNKDEGVVELYYERALLPEVIGLEAFPNNTHFKVTIESIEFPPEKLPTQVGNAGQRGYSPSVGGGGGVSAVVNTKKEETIYQKFKQTCEDYSGLDYYNRLKKHLGVEHLKDLEAKHSESMAADLLKAQENYIFWRKQNKDHIQSSSLIMIEYLTHKHNAYNLWLELFESFNNPK